MRTGDLVAGRFLVEREAGVGGMGRVYQARDEGSGRAVALKVLHASGDASSHERFEREAQILSSLSHPAIVEYVAHGEHEGSPFLAMEWLEGEPLSARLRRGPLALADAVELGVRVAEALSCAHEAGVLHRDVKPANLILGASDADVRVVDFGVARHARDTRGVTRTGMIVGTCAFMSPEQALAQRDIDARSDLFSLGCVLYECVSGSRAFGARDATAALAKVLLEEPAPLHQIAPKAPRALTELVSWLLRKDRAQRPATARIVTERLRAARADVGAASAEVASQPALGTRERRVIWVVLASNALATNPSNETMPEDAPTITDDEAGTGQLRAIVKQFGGTLAFLADATAIATFTGGVPTDEAPRAARCALAMREALPTSPIAIAMGRGDLPGGLGVPIGEVIDDAADALRMTPPGTIRLRGVDPGWLAGFEIAQDEHGVRVVRRAEGDLTPRTLLGRPTSCVGRDRELSMLEGLYEDCANEAQAKVALVTASAGAGKSRLRHELLARLARRDEPPHVLVARCDAMSAGAPFAAIADALRREARISSQDDDASQRAKLVALAPGDEVQAALLGELAGVPFPDEASDALRAARRDAFLMGDLVRAAFESWLASRERPVVLVVEDLHWGDVPSVRVLDSALRNLASRPLFVIALARPEVAELFPSLWEERGVVSIALAPLSKRAAEKLARETLGETASDAVIGSIVERAQGNAFFLEELVRGAARGDATLPDSIFGMLQTRLDALSAETRYVLRAASVFGDSFTANGAFALLGGTVARHRVEDQLQELARAEILSPAEGGGYRFRHALVRDATYATLTEDDRKLGHRLAAELLESTGGAGPLALAEHFVRGGTPERAIAHLRATAIKALEGNDLTGAVALADRALALSPSREDVGVLHATAAEASRWMGDYDAASRHGVAALEALEQGSVRWFRALGELIATCEYRREFEMGATKLASARATRAEGRDAVNARLVCLARGCTQLLEGGSLEEADAITQELTSAPTENLDDNTRGWMNWLLAMRALHDGNLAVFARNTEACLAAFERIGEVRNTSSQRINLGYAYAELGAFERAEALLRRVHRDAERVGLPMVCAYALQNLGNVLRALGRLEEAREQERRATVIGAAIGDRRIEGAARAYGALMTLELGDPATAESECRLALTALEKNPPLVGFAKAVLARALVARGRSREALAESRDALTILGESVEDGETFIRLTHIETLEKNGDLEGARSLAIESEARLRARGDRIVDDGLRKSFFERVPESSRTLAIAARLRGMTAPEKA